MIKDYDDSNWRSEYIDIKGRQLTKRQVELLEKGYKDNWPEENKGQCQSSLKEFYERHK